MKTKDNRWKDHYSNLKCVSINNIKNNEVIKKTMGPKRYPEQLKLLENFINLDNLSILEIGAGYGGLCKLIVSKYHIDKYEIIDNEEMLNISKKYLKSFDIKFVDAKNVEFTDFNSTLLISNYCIPELPHEYRKYILKKIFPKCSYFFIIDNGKYEKEYSKIFNINKRKYHNSYIFTGSKK